MRYRLRALLIAAAHVIQGQRDDLGVGSELVSVELSMTPRYKLRTLLILLAILPPLLWIGWGKYQAWKAERERQQAVTQFGAPELEQDRLDLGMLPTVLKDLQDLKDRATPPAVTPPDSSDLEHGKGP